MQRNFSFRQKLAGSFALLLSLILFHGMVAWFSLVEYERLFHEAHDVEQIVELTTYARMNEKSYVLTGERHFSITVQEQLQETQNLIENIIQYDSSLDTTFFLDIASSLEVYQNTFSQYIVYEDQHRALHSKSKRLIEEILKNISDLRQLDETLMNDIVKSIYWFLLVNKEGHWLTEEERLVAKRAGQDVINLLEPLQTKVENTKVKLVLHRISMNTNDYLEILSKIEELEKKQHSNEEKMKKAAEEVQALGKAATKHQQIRAQEGQKLTVHSMVFIFIVSMGVALWGTFYLSNRLTQPLKELATITSSLGEGNFHQRVKIEGDDEFHHLLLSINQMAENISNLTSNMEELVEERTKALEIEKIRFEKLFRNNPEGILILDENLYVLDANQAFTTIFGYTLPEIYQRRILDVFGLDNILTNTAGSYREETIRPSKEGHPIPVWIIKYSFQQLPGKTLHYFIYTDISERKKTEERLHFLSFHDSLTTLKNRTFFELEMNRLQDSQEACGLIVCDVDGLKFVNDHLGHAAGDQLLKDAAQLLSAAAGEHSLARVGGDEFVIFLPGSLKGETFAMAEYINRQINQADSLKMSVGYAHRENGEIHMEELFSVADKMMYSIKKLHKQSRDEKVST